MINLESLISMAERAGFSAQGSSHPSDVTFTTQLSLPFAGAMRESYSVCVASLPACASKRFQPFNAKQADRREQERVTAQLRSAATRLDENGLIFVYGLPRDLARAAAGLADLLTFRYWIAVRAMTA